MTAMLPGKECDVIVIEVESGQRGRRGASRVTSTPGGRRLRALREQAGKTQLWVEHEAELGTGYLQRVESGRVAQPARATLDRILSALDARYSERRELMELFGYTVATPPPSDADIAWARELCRHELHDVPFPAYVLDCTHRLVAWNHLFPCLLGAGPGGPLPETLIGASLPALWFDPASPLAVLVAEPDRFLPALIRALRYEMQLFGVEAWYVPLLERLWELPPFRRYWDVVVHEPPPAGAARALVPIKLAVPGTGLLSFRLSSEHFTRDARFRLIYYLPTDVDTMRQCAAWAIDPAP